MPYDGSSNLAVVMLDLLLDFYKDKKNWCAAKFCNGAICLSENGRTSVQYITNAPSNGASFLSATQIAVRAPYSSANLRRTALSDR